MELRTEWLGRCGYQEAWDRQHELVAARAAGDAPDTLILVEHPPVLTLGRHSEPSHIRAPDQLLAKRGIEVLRVERGGEVTYHGPGQLVAYPIVRLADAGLLLRPFVRALELAMADTAAAYGVDAGRRDGYPGCWIAPEAPIARKLGALGLRVERGVTYHGIALNVTTDLRDFELIDPCGMTGLTVTSIARELGWTGPDALPSTGSVALAGERFADALSRRLDHAVDGGADAREPRGRVDPAAAVA